MFWLHDGWVDTIWSPKGTDLPDTYNEWVSAAKVDWSHLDGLCTPGNICNGDGNGPMCLAGSWGLWCCGHYGVQYNRSWVMHEVLPAFPMVCILRQQVDIPVETKKSVKLCTNLTRNYIPSLELSSHHLSTVKNPYLHESSIALGMPE